jgi:hypothetical protein
MGMCDAEPVALCSFGVVLAIRSCAWLLVVAVHGHGMRRGAMRARKRMHRRRYRRCAALPEGVYEASRLSVQLVLQRRAAAELVRSKHHPSREAARAIWRPVSADGRRREQSGVRPCRRVRLLRHFAHGRERDVYDLRLRPGQRLPRGLDVCDGGRRAERDDGESRVRPNARRLPAAPLLHELQDGPRLSARNRRDAAALRRRFERRRVLLSAVRDRLELSARCDMQSDALGRLHTKDVRDGRRLSGKRRGGDVPGRRLPNGVRARCGLPSVERHPSALRCRQDMRCANVRHRRRLPSDARHLPALQRRNMHPGMRSRH